MKVNIEKARRLVGAVTEKDLRYVDSFVCEDMGLFMPVGGACFYALTPLHSHPSYMFVLPFNDKTALSISGKTIRARPGRLSALSPGIEHHELPADFPPRYIAVFIERGFFEGQLSGYPVEKEVVFRGESYDTPPNLLSMLKQFMIEADNGGPGSEAVLHGLSLGICHSVIRSVCDVRALNDRITPRVEIDRAVEHMHSGLAGKITVRNLADIACMSQTHFTRIFKKEIGCTPMGYLNRIRMERVKRLLLAGDKSITDTALECGFGSAAYLSASFRKTYGLSPADYLKTLKKGFIPKRNGRILKD